MTLEDDLRRQLAEEQQRTLDLCRQIQEACARALREREEQERREQERRDRENREREINNIHEQIVRELTDYYGFRR